MPSGQEMTTDDTTIAVIIAAFSAEATIGRAVASALAQKHVAEVVVIDDASRDGTADAARRADDGSGRLAVIGLAKNAGPARARNIALDKVRSDCVCVLDADDYFLPDRMERLLRAGAGAPWDMLADDIIIVPEELEGTGSPRLSPDGAGEAITLDLASFAAGDILPTWSPRGGLGFLKPILSRRFMQEHALRYDETLRLGEDYALYVCALMAGARFRLVGACGYVAVERRGSISSSHATEDLARLAAFEARTLASEADLSDRERKSLAAHHWNTMCRHRHRQILDCRREQGFLQALGMLLSTPRFLPYVAAETLRAKTTALWIALAPRDAIHRRRPMRLLLGLPHGPLSLAADAEPARAGDAETAFAP
jgi:succinoglycan biosynthesis protein ExoU